MLLITVVILLVMFLVFAAVRSFAVITVQPVSAAQAKEWGVAIRTTMVATNQTGVWLELSPKSKLATATSALLEIRTANQNRVSKTLLPLVAGKIIFYFSTEPADLAACTVTVYAKVGNGNSSYTGFQFKMNDFINPQACHPEPVEGSHVSRQAPVSSLP